MKTKFLLSVLLVGTCSVLSAVDWQAFLQQNNSGGIRFRGPDRQQIDFYSSAKRADNLSAVLRGDCLELRVRELKPGELVKARFHLFGGIPYAGRNLELNFSASFTGRTSCDLLMEGRVDPAKNPNKKIRPHFWRKTTHPFSEERTRIVREYDFPEGLSGLSLRLDIREPGVFRIYDVSLKQAKSKLEGLEPGHNYIRNGGAERGWYGTAGLMEECARMHDSGKIDLNRNQSYDSLMSMTLDRENAYSGNFSFRLFTPRKGLGRGVFFLNPVPFAVHEKAYLSCWMKSDRKCRISYGLFLANGIAYHTGAVLGTEWKRYEFAIPQWGKQAPGISLYGDPAFGYSSTVPFCIPQFNVPEGATVWLDNIYYSVGVSGGDYTEKPVTASARLDRDNAVYRPGDSVKVSLTVRNLTGTGQAVCVRRKLLDCFGVELPGTGAERRFTLEPKECRTIGETLIPPPEQRGAMNAVYDVNGETTGLYFGVLDAPGSLHPRLGINIQEGNIDKSIEFMKEFRIGVSRIWGPWRGWRYFGFRYAEALHKAGIRNLYVVATPDAVKGVRVPGSETLMPKDCTDWFNELAPYIRKHKGQIAIYEFLNEYNIWNGRVRNPNPEILDDPTPDVYVKALTEFRKLLRKHDPDALSAGPTTCGTDVPYIHNILRLGAAGSLDMITEHSYRQLPECPDYDADLKALQAGAAQFGRFRFAQTEAGGLKLPHLPDNLIEPYGRRKASWDVRNMLIGWANGLDHYSHFMMSLIRTGCDWNVTLLGNGDNHYHPLPSVALFAYRAAADMIGNGICVKRLRLGMNSRGYLFDRGDVRVAVLWKWNGKADTMHLSGFLRNHAEIYDFMGSRIRRAELSVGEFPLYFITSASAEELERGILTSGREESAVPYRLESVPLGERRFAIKIDNQSMRNLSGSIRIGGREKTFRDLPPEESRLLEFFTEKPISEKNQEITVQTLIDGGKTMPPQKLGLRAIFVPKAEKPVIPDGDLSDWPARSRPVPLTLTGRLSAWSKAEDAVRAEARLAWDDSFLYLAVTAWKQGHFPAESSGSLWRGDSVQTAFDTVRNASAGQIGYQDDDFEYDIALFEGKPLVYRSRSSAATYDSLGKPTGIVSEVRTGIRRLPDRIVYEMAFPKQAVSPFRFNPGASMRFNVLLNLANEEGRAGYLQLTPGIGDRKQPAAFLDLILIR